MLCYEAGDRRVNPNIMACTRGPYGKCTRCGVAHPGSRAWADLDADAYKAAEAEKVVAAIAWREAKKAGQLRFWYGR